MHTIRVDHILAIVHRASAVYDKGEGLSDEEIFHRMTATLARVLGGQLFINRAAITSNTNDTFVFEFGVPAFADLAGHIENDKLHDLTCKAVQAINTHPGLISFTVTSFLKIVVTVRKDFFVKAEERRLQELATEKSLC